REAVGADGEDRILAVLMLRQLGVRGGEGHAPAGRVCGVVAGTCIETQDAGGSRVRCGQEARRSTDAAAPPPAAGVGGGSGTHGGSSGRRPSLFDTLTMRVLCLAAAIRVDATLPISLAQIHRPPGRQALVAVDRAIAELRRGAPVILGDGAAATVVLAAETA